MKKKITRPAYANLNVQQVIILFLSVVFTFAFILSSIFFNMGIKFYQKGILLLEEVLDGHVFWDDVYISPSGIITFKDIYIYERDADEDTSSETAHFLTINEDQHIMLYAKEITLDISPTIAMKYAFTPFLQLSEHDQTRLNLLFNGRKSINYYILKMLRRIEISTVEGELTFPRDQYLLDLLEEMLFSKQLLPMDCDLVLNDINVRINLPVASIKTNTFDIHFNLSDYKGIHAEFGGGMNSTKFKQEVSLNLGGTLATTDFFNHLNVQTNFENITYNTINFLPLTLELDKSLENLAINISATDADTDFNIVGNIVDNTIDVNLALKDVNLENIVSVDMVNMRDTFSIKNDKISGNVSLVGDFKEKTFDYQANITNDNGSKNNININIYGDESYLNFDDLVIEISNQYLLVTGGLSFLNLGLNGNVSFALAQPLLQKSVQGNFIFENTPYSSVGVSSDFYINNVKQDDIKLEYSSLERFVELSLLQSQEIIPILNLVFSETNQYHLLMRNFPLNLLTSFMLEDTINSMESIQDYFIYSDISFIYSNSNISDLEYDIGMYHSKGLQNYIKVKGVFDHEQLFIEDMKFYFQSRNKNPIQGSASGNVYVSFYNRVKNPLDLKLILQDDKRNHQSTYKISIKALRNSHYRISINQDIEIDVDFDDEIIKNFRALKKVSISAEDFLFPYTELLLTTNSSMVNFNATIPNKINVDLQLYLSQNHQKVFGILTEYENYYGNISDFFISNGDSNAITEKTLEGFGSYSYDKDKKLIEANIIETPNIGGDTSIIVQKTIKSQSLNIGYGLISKNLAVEARNIKLGTFTNRVNGIVNGDFLLDLKNKNLSGIILPSTIALKSKTYNVTTEFYVDKLDEQAKIDINKLNISDTQTKLFFPAITIDKFNHIDANFLYTKLVKKKVYQTIYEGNLFFKSVKPIYYVQDDVDKNPFTVIDNFNASVILNPVSLKDSKIARKYRYNIQIRNRLGNITVKDAFHDIFIELDNHSGQIKGKIGHSDSIFQASLSGSYDFTHIDSTLRIMQFDVGRFDDEYWNNKSILEIDDMIIKGALTFKGESTVPSIYGYIEMNPLSGYMPYFNKELFFNNMKILFSDKDISLINSYIKVDKDKLFLNAHGRINGLLLDAVQLKVFSDEDGFKAKKVRFGQTEVTGLIKGQVDVLIENDTMEIDADTFLDNALVSSERFSKRQQESIRYATISPKDPITIVANIKVITGQGVVFAWPRSSFPVLKAGFAKDQEVIIEYDGFTNDYGVLGDLYFNSGTIYYFDKPFDIKDLKITIDDYNEVTNPYVDILNAEADVRYNNQRYILYLNANSTTLSDMSVNISSTPYLSSDDLVKIFGQSIVPNSNVASDANVDSVGLVSSLVKVSDTISNIGFFSRFEHALQRSLHLDYVAFRSKVVQNLLEYSINPSNRNIASQISPEVSSDNFFQYLLNNSTMELGKYIDIIYINLQIELDVQTSFENDPYATWTTDTDYVISYNTALNVEMPTPFFDLTWTGAIKPYVYRTYSYIPISLLTISWSKRY